MTKKILIDPGHGPGNANGGKNGYKEFAGMWKLSNFLKSALEQYGFTVELTRTQNTNPALAERGRLAAGYDLFISQHSNASSGAARGVEVFYSLKIPQDRAFAAELSKEIAAFMNNPDRGAKTRESTNTKGADHYTVIFEAQRAGAKSVLLVESGFHDNELDEAVLLNYDNLRAIADIQARVITKHLGVAVPPATSPSSPSDKGLTPITGTSIASVAQMRTYIQRINPAAPDIAALYIAEGEKEGIRGDIAFAQSCLETGNFKFTGGTAVTIDQNNFCGMGVVQMGVKGNSYATPQEGIRAQLQHLKAYANDLPLVNQLVTPTVGEARFRFVQRGVAPFVEWLGAQENPQGRGWAMGAGYGAKILRILNAIINTSTPASPEPETPAVNTVNFDIFGQRVSIPGNIENGVTIVHARPLVEAMGFAIGWDGKTGVVEVRK